MQIRECVHPKKNTFTSPHVVCESGQEVPECLRPTQIDDLFSAFSCCWLLMPFLRMSSLLVLLLSLVRHGIGMSFLDRIKGGINGYDKIYMRSEVSPPMY